MDKDYTLALHTSVLANNVPTTHPITDMAGGWHRSIRFQGGFWMGGFTVQDELDVLHDLFYVHLGSEIIERSGGDRTWEGMIYDMTLNDDPDAPELMVKAAGYAHTLNWRHATADDTTDDADDWIGSILTTDCPFVVTQTLSPNTLQVRRSSKLPTRCFDEIMRVVSMGDAANNIWRFYLTQNRRAVYEQVNTGSPEYFARGGVIRKRSLDTFWNHIAGKYVDEADAVQTLAAASQADSIGRYGRREYRLLENNVPQTAMEALRDLYLSENAWPWGRPVGMAPGAPLYNRAGDDVTDNPWRVTPGICRDMAYPAGGQEAGSALADQRDFVIDEVEAGWDENAGQSYLRVKTDLFEEADALGNYYQMKYSGMDGASGAGGHVDSWRGFKPGSKGWGKLTPDERRQTKWGREHLK